MKAVLLIAVNYVRTIVDQFNAEWVADHGLPGAPARLDTRARDRYFRVGGGVGQFEYVAAFFEEVFFAVVSDGDQVMHPLRRDSSRS